MSKSHMSLREANASDSDFLLGCRNDVETIAASRTTEPVDEQSHKAWLSAVLTDSMRKLFVAEMDSQAVGTVRLDFTDDCCEVSWTVAAAARGKGVGRRMVCEAVTKVSMPMTAVVRTTNVASQRIAAAAGFQIVESDDEWTRFERPANEANDG